MRRIGLIMCSPIAFFEDSDLSHQTCTLDLELVPLVNDQTAESKLVAGLLDPGFGAASAQRQLGCLRRGAAPVADSRSSTMRRRQRRR